MSLIQLKDVGKIYASGGVLSVGIRHVSLDFDIGEFVAVTGKSGSGKTTLLNVMSGMDTYEEGELFVSGEPTSHYTQADWELFREKYISFIFQDYNIIESFTVLENVELALGEIEDRAERRRRANELLDRVGLTAHRNHRGSKLSGGQKQRTVIARALAKDSPIILADEPTGNLDSVSSAEIIKLLSEISRDKLVIVVTHSFEELAECATREVRFFDGGVERDTPLRTPEKKEMEKGESAPAEGKKVRRRHVLRGFELGWHRFLSLPRLSAFMCFLMTLAVLATFFVTAFCVTGRGVTAPSYMFMPIEGRSVVVRQDGAPMTDGELSALAERVGATSYLHYDALLDHPVPIGYYDGRYFRSVRLAFTNERDVTPDVGRLPEGENEALLVLPIDFQPLYGKKELEKKTVSLYNGAVELSVVGVSYYYDNTREYGSILLTNEGFEALSAADYLASGWKAQSSFLLNFRIQTAEGEKEPTFSFGSVVIDEGLAGRSVAFSTRDKDFKAAYDAALSFTVDLAYTVTEYEYYHDTETKREYNAVGVTYDDDHTVRAVENMQTVYSHEYDFIEKDEDVYFGDSGRLAISPLLARELMEGVRNDNYTQASLFFSGDAAAREARGALREAGYLGVSSTATYVNANEKLSVLLESGGMLILWVMMVFFFAVFVALCSTRAMAAKKGDLAILRSMGIPNLVVRISTYAQMLYAVLPSFLVLLCVALWCYLTPRVNSVVPFLHAPQYVLIFFGLFIIVALVTRWHNKRMFGESVRKTLRGGDAA